MSITKSTFSQFIKAFEFKELFNEMGWNNDRTNQPIIVDDMTYNIIGIAEKSGFRIFTCSPSDGTKIPDSVLRKKIEHKVTKLFQEHLLIFIDNTKTRQIWQLAVRKAGSPTKITETRYIVMQDPELLYQRTSGLFFTLDEEEKVTIIDVTTRIADNFQKNSEKITKKFYEHFRKQHDAFLKLMKGIDDKMSMDWYASIMLNRLMFCYFIQKKGFLDNNTNYLRDKLKLCKEKKGNNKFYSFYRNFLLTLFHQGLGSCNHDKSLEIELGNIPYLNGGLFDEHNLEKKFTNIQIEDTAFETLFDFFDDYEWHLDIRASATGKEINPDVIGYIFEKYINDRSQMGAYYTKEDITDYISKNCIIPWLFDEVKRNYSCENSPFKKNGWLWLMVKNSGNGYIYDAVKYGIPEVDLFEDLPDEIQKGFNTELEKKVVDGNTPWLWELRKEWNKPAPPEIALPTEIYREVIERRKRYADIVNKINNGEIKMINDFITYNLNIREFAQDVVETTEDPELLKHFYKALCNITILDPTCGSGAFLFAAMNILEPLYEACIQRMKTFIDISHEEKYEFFENTLKNINTQEHPNLSYFIYKSIILNNLYGVDIMNEAVEIAKLRLFLKLMSTVDADYYKPNLGLEPLPDIDFNIRSGNTLVGFATKSELDNISLSTIEGNLEKDKIEEQCNIAARSFIDYKTIQLKGSIAFEDLKKLKGDLNKHLEKLTDKLDKLLHQQNKSNINYNRWEETHQPFHWFVEFYEIIHGRGGFDVIIGNPPYVEYPKVRDIYKLKNFETEKCNNLYGYIIERSYQILNKIGIVGMIIPISAFSNSSMESLQKYFKKFPLSYLSNFHQRPAALFEGVLQRLSIFLSYKQIQIKGVYSTIVFRWRTDNRNILFLNIFYTNNEDITQSNSLKIGFPIEVSIFNKYKKHLPLTSLIIKTNIKENSIHYRTAGGGYWVTILNTPFDTTSLSNKSTSFKKEYNSKVVSAVLNSNLFWWYYSINFDQFNFKDYMILGFRFNYPKDKLVIQKFITLSDKLETELLANAKIYTINSKTRGSNKTITYNKYYSKKLMNEIDEVLAQHYGFTQEELDFIINYDIKYRMGKELNEDEATTEI